MRLWLERYWLECCIAAIGVVIIVMAILMKSGDASACERRGGHVEYQGHAGMVCVETHPAAGQDL